MCEAVKRELAVGDAPAKLMTLQRFTVVHRQRRNALRAPPPPAGRRGSSGRGRRREQLVV
jgi:hypothetical protein